MKIVDEKVMDISNYLNRIGFSEVPQPTLESFISLHQNHLYHIPYENLDIKLGKKILLEENKIFDKVVFNKRGGFCYELNYLFFKLLLALGFKATIISSRIFNDGVPGPDCDHMSVIVEIGGEKWLGDVGFGDLFIKPVNIDIRTPQKDESYVFKVENLDAISYLLLISEDGGLTFERKYQFDLNERKLEEFIPQCEFKQTDPSSYFVENNICSLPTNGGRKTLFNEKFTKRIYGQKLELIITSTNQEISILEKEFDIRLN